MEPESSSIQNSLKNSLNSRAISKAQKLLHHKWKRGIVLEWVHVGVYPRFSLISKQSWRFMYPCTLCLSGTLRGCWFSYQLFAYVWLLRLYLCHCGAELVMGFAIRLAWVASRSNVFYRPFIIVIIRTWPCVFISVFQPLSLFPFLPFYWPLLFLRLFLEYDFLNSEQFLLCQCLNCQVPRVRSLVQEVQKD